MVSNKLLRTFEITADFRDIDLYNIEKGPVNISYSLPFALQEARAAAGIDPLTWEQMPGTPLWMTLKDEFSKCHIMIWWKYRNKIEAVQSTARIKESKRKAKNG